MLNHIHLIVESDDMAGFVRDFKKHTSKQILKNIQSSEPQILYLFQSDSGFNIWAKTNMPKYIESETFLLQKINYIHNNPVKKGYVMRCEDWYWSSANEYCELKPNYIL
jgi:REP element-mobilizing transposase RayT